MKHETLSSINEWLMLTLEKILAAKPEKVIRWQMRCWPRAGSGGHKKPEIDAGSGDFADMMDGSCAWRARGQWQCISVDTANIATLIQRNGAKQTLFLPWHLKQVRYIPRLYNNNIHEYIHHVLLHSRYQITVHY